MKSVFVDTSHLAASFHPMDSLHSEALRIENDLRSVQLVTTDFVLTELLNYFSDFPEYLKDKISRSVDAILQSPRYLVVGCSRPDFLAGKEFYAN